MNVFLNSFFLRGQEMWLSELYKDKKYIQNALMSLKVFSGYFLICTVLVLIALIISTKAKLSSY